MDVSNFSRQGLDVGYFKTLFFPHLAIVLCLLSWMVGLKESMMLENGFVKTAFHEAKDLAIDVDEPHRYTVIWVFVCINHELKKRNSEYKGRAAPCQTGTARYIGSFRCLGDKPSA